MSNLYIIPNIESAPCTNVSSFLEMFLSGRNKNTMEAYRKDLDDFRQFFEVSTLEEMAYKLLSAGHGNANALVLQYRIALVNRKLQSSTINRRLAALRSLVKLAGTLGLVPWELAIPNLKNEPYRDTKGPGKTAFQKMLAQVEDLDTPKRIRDYAILHLLYDLALRASELTNLDLSDVDLSLGTIAILGKGKTQKTKLSMPDVTKQAVLEWIQVRDSESGPLFINFDRAKKGNRLTRVGLYCIIRKLGEKVGTKTRPHGLRHLSITEACKLAQANGYGLEEVLDHSRHSNVSTLMVYRDRERNLQGKIAALVAR